MGSSQTKQEEEEQSDDGLLNKVMLKKIRELYRSKKTNFNDHFYGTVDVLEKKEGASFHIVTKSVVSTTEEQHEKTSSQFFNRFAQLNHPNVITLQAYQSISDSNFCSKMYKTTLFLEFIDKTLEDEMIQMGENQFKEDDIWFFIDSVVGSLAFLNKRGLKHESLVFSNIYSVQTPQGVKLFKLADSVLMNYMTNYQTALRVLNRHDEDKTDLNGIYLSPEQLLDLQNRVKHPTYDPIKSDVFTLGMLILDIALWRRIDFIYDWQYCQVNEQALNVTLNQLKSKGIYSQNLINLIGIMLHIDPEMRSDFTGLDAYLSQHILQKGKRITDHIQPGNYRIFSEEELTAELTDEFKRRQMAQMKKTAQENYLEKQKTEASQINNQNNIINNNNNNNSPQQQSMYQKQNSYLSNSPSPDHMRTTNYQNLDQVQTLHTQTQGALSNLHNILDPQQQNLTPEQQFMQQQIAQTLVLQQQQQQYIQQQFQMLQQQQQAYQMQMQGQQLNQFQNNDHFLQSMAQNSQNPLQQFNTPVNNNNIQKSQHVNFDELGLKNEYQQIQYPNGSLYEGNTFNGLRNGMGTLTFPDNGYYTGEWKMNQMHGKGILYYKDKIKAYEGEWFEDKFHKNGTLYNNQCRQLQGDFDYRNFTNLGECWEQYQGDFNLDLRDGFGILNLSNGEKYAGNFSQDKIHGYGTYYTLHGEILNGYWENDILSKIL